MKNQHSVADVLTPDTLRMLGSIDQHGSMAAAARALGLVPSALSYRVRQLEQALDVLLFDRSSRQARLTEAGQELLREGRRLLLEIDAVAHRVRRVATGWEPQLTLALDSVISRTTVLELCEAFYALQPPTRLKLREETLSGTLASLNSGRADLAIGVVNETSAEPGIRAKPLGQLDFVFALAPQHPLAALPEPLSDELIGQYRAVAVADSVPSGDGMTLGLLGGQDVLTVPHMAAKLQAQLRGLGVGFLPRYMAQAHMEAGALVERAVQRASRIARCSYAWRHEASAKTGRALQWWLHQLERPATRRALLSRP